MLEINNLTIFIDDHKLIDQLNLVLNKQDKLAIIGEEGNGKSTLLKSIITDLDYAVITGKVQTFKHHISYLKQTLDNKEINMIVKDYLFKDDNDYFLLITEFYQHLITLQLDDTILDKKIEVLSGGEKVKIQLLKILLRNPDIILLDEPSNDLDIQTLQWLEQFIKNSSTPIIFISHDETLLSNCANRILHLEQLNKQTKCKYTIFNGGYDEYTRTRKALRSKEIQIANKEKDTYLKKKEKLNNVQNAVHDALNDTVRNPGKAALLKKKMKSIKAMEHRFEKEGYSSIDSIEENILLVFNDVSIPSKKCIINYSLDKLTVSNTTLANNIHFEIYGAKHIAIIGKNGCGKTTLLTKMYNILKDRRDLKIGYMPQHYESLLDLYKTPLDLLSPDFSKERTTLVRQYLGNLNFTRDEMISPIQNLSGGSKAKLILLHLMIENYDVLLLDEPTRNISPLSNPVIRQALKDYQGCIISVSHDRKFISEVCEDVYELTKDGLQLVKQ